MGAPTTLATECNILTLSTAEQHKKSDSQRELPSDFPKVLTQEEIESLDIPKEDRFFFLTDQVIRRKEVYRSQRCQRCWHFPVRCICARLHPIAFNVNVRIVIFMHYLEYGNAADTSKLFLTAHPGRAHLLLYGRENDHKTLHHLLKDSARSMVLYPSEKSLTLTEWRKWSEERREKEFRVKKEEDGMSDIVQQLAQSTLTEENSQGNTTTPRLMGQTSGYGSLANNQQPDIPNTSETVTIVIIDGTWRQAKQMIHVVSKMCPQVQHLKLEPQSMNWWVKRGNRSGFTRKQPQPGRVCSVEACALLLLEMGEKEEVIEELLHFVNINSRAINGLAACHKL